MKNKKQSPKSIRESLLKMAIKATEKIEVEEIKYARNKKRIAAKSKVQRFTDGSLLIPSNMSGKALTKLKSQL